MLRDPISANARLAKSYVHVGALLLALALCAGLPTYAIAGDTLRVQLAQMDQAKVLPPKSGESSMRLAVEARCSDQKLRTSIAVFTWAPPPKALRQRVDITPFRDGFR